MSLKNSRIVPESILIEVAKAVAHRLNNILSVVLTDSQLAISQVPETDEAGTNLRTYLQDIAIAAGSGGAVVHQFQKCLDSLSIVCSQDEMSACAELLSLLSPEQQTINIGSTVGANSKTENLQIISSPEQRSLDIYPVGKKTHTVSAQVKYVSILIVDDEDKIRHALSYALTLEGHHVITAADGQEALNIFQNGSYDVVFVDLKMPGMDGWEVIRSIKQMDPSTTVVLMTGWRVRLDDERLKATHVDAVVTKPFELSEIIHLISMVIESNSDI